MYVDRILYPVTALGPGKRVALWVAGCSRHCAGCANPELWERQEHQRIPPRRLARAITEGIRGEIDGITITGGEPFEQARELAELLELLPRDLEVLVFSGCRYGELRERADARELLARTDVLIDGEYRDEENDNHSALRGSSNQTIHYLNASVRERYEEYLREGRKIQNFVYDYRTVSVGIHNRGEKSRRGAEEC